MSYGLGTQLYIYVESDEITINKCASCGVIVDRWNHDPGTVLIGSELYCKKCFCKKCYARFGIEAKYLFEYEHGRLCFSCYKKCKNK
jgi:hypothetical protein